VTFADTLLNIINFPLLTRNAILGLLPVSAMTRKKGSRKWEFLKVPFI
jgi:hypothetical protein